MKKVIASTIQKGWLSKLPGAYRSLVESFIMSSVQKLPRLESKPSFVQVSDLYFGALHKMGPQNLVLSSVQSPFIKELGSAALPSVDLGSERPQQLVPLSLEKKSKRQDARLPKQTTLLGIRGKTLVSSHCSRHREGPLAFPTLTRVGRSDFSRNTSARFEVREILRTPVALGSRRGSRRESPLKSLRTLTSPARTSSKIREASFDMPRRDSFSSQIYSVAKAKNMARHSLEVLHKGDHSNVKVETTTKDDGVHLTISVNFEDRGVLQDGVAAGKKVQSLLFGMEERDFRKMTLNFRGGTSMDFLSFYTVFGPWKVDETEIVVQDYDAAKMVFDTLGSAGHQGIMLTQEKIGKDVVIRMPENFQSLLLAHIQDTKTQFSKLDLDFEFDEYAAFLRSRTFTAEQWQTHLDERVVDEGCPPLTGFVFDQPSMDPLKGVGCLKQRMFVYDPALRASIKKGEIVANASDQNTAIGDGWSFDPGNPVLTQLLKDVVKDIVSKGRSHVHVVSHHHHDHNAYLWLLLSAFKELPQLRSSFTLLHSDSPSSKRQLAGLLLSDPKSYWELNHVLKWVKDGDVVPLEKGCVTICEPQASLRHFIDSIGAVFLNVAKVQDGITSFDVTHMMGDVNTQFFPINWAEDADKVRDLFFDLYRKVFSQIRQRVIEARGALESTCADSIGIDKFKLNVLAFFEIGHFVGMPKTTEMEIYQFVSDQAEVLKAEGLVDMVETKSVPYHMKCEGGFSEGKAISPLSGSADT